jgi:tetratricopeptide (TPR) repeat protein
MPEADLTLPRNEHVNLLRRIVQHFTHHSGAGIVYLFSDYSLANHWLLKTFLEQVPKDSVVTLSNINAGVDSFLTPLFSFNNSKTRSTVFWLFLDNPEIKVDYLRDQVLARLNENRAFLESNNLFVVLVLPSRFQQRTAEVAPDLWSVRSASYQVPSWVYLPSTEKNQTLLEKEILSVSTLPSEALKQRWIQQWSAWKRDHSKPLSPALGRQIANRYLDQHLPQEAEFFAAQALEVSRQQLHTYGKNDLATLSELSMSLSLMGNILLSSGYAERARDLFQESLNIDYTMVEKLGENHQTLRDLSVSLVNMGDVSREMRLLMDAQKFYQKSLEIDERLLELGNHSTQGLRDLSITLSKLGRTAYNLGDLEKARFELDRSLAIIDELTESSGISAQNLRDSIVLLTSIADVDLSAGRLKDARARLDRALRDAKQLVELGNRSSQTLRDLSVVLEKIGDVAYASDELDDAQQAYEECLEIRRELLDLTNARPRSLRDFSISLSRIGDIAFARGDLDTARKRFIESLETDRAIVALTGKTYAGLREIGISLNNIGRVANKQNHFQEAQENYEGSIDIYRELFNSLESTPDDRINLAITLYLFGQTCLKLKDTAKARNAFQESAQLSQTSGKIDANALAIAYLSLEDLAEIAKNSGELEEAKRLHEESNKLARQMKGLTAQPE